MDLGQECHQPGEEVCCPAAEERAEKTQLSESTAHKNRFLVKNESKRKRKS